MKACQLLMRKILGGDFIQDSVCVCVCFPKSVYRNIEQRIEFERIIIKLKDPCSLEEKL